MMRRPYPILVGHDAGALQFGMVSLEFRSGRWSETAVKVWGRSDEEPKIRI